MEDGVAIIPPWINSGGRRPFGGRALMGSLSGRVRVGTVCDTTRD